jgi:hypothetical protein
VGEDEIESGLRLSSRRVGRLYPVLLDKHGNVIDGINNAMTMVLKEIKRIATLMYRDSTEKRLRDPR